MYKGKLLTLILIALSLVSSELYRGQPTANVAIKQLEDWMNRKGRGIAFSIPSKSFLKEEKVSPINLDSVFNSDRPALHFYRNEYTRAVVIDFFVELAGSEEVAIPVIYNSDKNDLSILLTFSLMYIESSFYPYAVNINKDSIDRGIFQLNNKSFPHLEEQDFFTPSLNASYGIEYLKWCLTQSSNQEEGIAMYNAGYGNVMRGIIPETTQIYIQKLQQYHSNLSQKFKHHLREYLSNSPSNLATMKL